MKNPISELQANILKGIVVSLTLLTAQGALADSGFYVGGSAGTADIEIEDGIVNFDESDFAWKAFGGFNFDLLVVDLAVEGGYVNFGSPDSNIGGLNTEVDLDALTGFGLAGLELGPLGVFAKVGMIRWDSDVSIVGVGTDGESGTDPAYGVGARFSIGSIEFRGEYEMFDIDVDGVDSSDLSMLSAGFVWTF